MSLLNLLVKIQIKEFIFLLTKSIRVSDIDSKNELEELLTK